MTTPDPGLLDEAAETTTHTEPRYAVGRSIDPETDPAVCVMCFWSRHRHCTQPCDCTHE